MSDTVESIKIEDDASAKVVKGGAKMTKEEREKKLAKQDEPAKISFPATITIYERTKTFLEEKCKVADVDINKVYGDLIQDATVMHHEKKCPYCQSWKNLCQNLQEVIIKSQGEGKVRKMVEKKRKADRKKKKKIEKASRKKNR